MWNTVTKRDGTVVPSDLNKLTQWADWAYEGNTGAWSPIVAEVIGTLYDGIPTSEINNAMVRILLSKKNTQDARAASRILLGTIYKEVHGSITPPKFSDRYRTLVAHGHWKDFNLTQFELDAYDQLIDHAYDFNYEWASVQQWLDKYALKDLQTMQPVESIQETLMGIAICLFETEATPQERVKYVTRYYRKSKARKLNQATPILASSRTGENAQASCCVVSSDDTTPSIIAAHSAVTAMTAARAGIGTEYDVRAKGDVVGNNKCKHGGLLPIYKALLENIKQFTQGVRGGAATTTFNVLNPEIFDLLKLKLVTTPDEKRILLLDYSLALNNEFLRRAAQDLDWMLISKKHAPDLHHAMYEDRENFPALMQKYLDEGHPHGRVLKARTIFATWLTSRQECSRYYAFNIDNVNDHTPFLEVIRLSNLCQEIALHTRAFGRPAELYMPYQEGSGVVAMCFLMAVDVGKIESEQDHYETIAIGQRALDNIISNMHYPLEVIGDTSNGYRSIGIGITNMAYRMAKEGELYSEEGGRNLAHRIAESHMYYSLLASTELAQERGPLPFIHKSKWKDGYLPIDSYKKDVDQFHSQPLLHDWEGYLRPRVIKYGVRFMVHVAHMPCETSSVFGYSTNGLYPVRRKLIYKASEDARLLFIVPEYDTLKDKYELAWDISTRDLYKFYGIIQKFTDQAISADTYVDYNTYPDGKVPMSETMSNNLFSWKVGMKTHYYLVPRTDEDYDDVEGVLEDGGGDPCGGACKM